MAKIIFPNRLGSPPDTNTIVRFWSKVIGYHDPCCVKSHQVILDIYHVELSIAFKDTVGTIGT